MIIVRLDYEETAYTVSLINMEGRDSDDGWRYLIVWFIADDLCKCCCHHEFSSVMHFTSKEKDAS